MYGAGRGVLTHIFETRGIPHVAIRQELNPLFPGINPEPILPHVAMLQETVVKEKCHAGLATDGDADRRVSSGFWGRQAGIDGKRPRRIGNREQTRLIWIPI